jgi:hypothetical protein
MNWGMHEATIWCDEWNKLLLCRKIWNEDVEIMEN